MSGCVNWPDLRRLIRRTCELAISVGTDILRFFCEFGFGPIALLLKLPGSRSRCSWSL